MNTRFVPSLVLPNKKEVNYWVDLKEDPYGGIVKYYNGYLLVKLINLGNTGSIDLSELVLC